MKSVLTLEVEQIIIDRDAYKLFIDQSYEFSLKTISSTGDKPRCFLSGEVRGRIEKKSLIANGGNRLWI
jgi:hypothetical protein